MKRILLVDDDFLALNAFFTLADWEKYGLSIAHEAHNGQEALDYLRDNRPDIAFIDVCMPDMDGISLLQQIRSHDPSILCIMLSSYSDYPYVREALKHGAADYLLKHEITGDSMLSFLKQYGVDTTQLKAEAEEDTETRLLKLFSDHRIQSGALSGLLALGSLSEGRTPIEVQRSSIHQTCRHILHDSPGAAVCSPCLSELVILFPGDAPENALDKAQEYISRMKKALQKYHHMEYTFLPVKYCADPAQLDHAYQLFHRKYSLTASAAKSTLSSEENIALMLAVVNHQKTLIETLVRSLHADAKSRNDVDSFGRDMLSLYLHLKQLLGITGDTIPRLPSDTAQWEAFAVRMLFDLSEYDTAAAPCSKTIRQALDYLHQHYAQDISLNDVARHCNVSYNHLSFLFKKETGENIISYLNQLRVYQAARLILFDTLPVSAVSEKVGFNCYNHFFATFRSITGMAPSEFRKNAQAVEWMIKFSHAIRPWGLTGKLH